MKNVSKLVKGINEFGMKAIAGTLIYAFAGCVPLQNMSDGEKASLIGSALLIGSDISNDPKDSQKMAVAGAIVSTYGQLQHDLEVAEAGKSDVIVNNYVLDNSQSDNQKSQERSSLNVGSSLERRYALLEDFVNDMNYEERWEYVKELKNIDKSSFNYEEKLYFDNLLSVANSSPKGFFMYEQYVDFDKKGDMNLDEIIGLNKYIYDINDLDRLTFSFYGERSPLYEGRLNLKIWNMDDGELIYESLKKNYDSFTIINFNVPSIHFSKPGNYTAVLATPNSDNFFLTFRAVK